MLKHFKQREAFSEDDFGLSLSASWKKLYQFHGKFSRARAVVCSSLRIFSGQQTIEAFAF